MQTAESKIASLWFERLETLLKGRKLPCEQGPARECSAEEFMFMHVSGSTKGHVAHFKHSDTRNYIEVRPYEDQGAFSVPSPNGYELFVPFQNTPFHKGFFDTF